MRGTLALTTMLLLVGSSEARGQEAGEPPPSEAPARALTLHDEAKELYARGRYQEAVDKLEEAVALDPEAELLHYNLGLIEEKRGNLDRAIEHYQRCLALEDDLEERAQLQHIIDRLEGVKRHQAAARTPVMAEAPEAPSPQGPDEPRAPAHESGPSAWTLAVGSFTAAACVTTVVLAARAASLDPGGEATTNAAVGIDDLERDAAEAHRLAIAADILGAVAAAGAVATIALALAPPGEDDEAAIVLGPGGGALRWRF